MRDRGNTEIYINAPASRPCALTPELKQIRLAAASEDLFAAHVA
jgi:hypothetical protein